MHSLSTVINKNRKFEIDQNRDYAPLAVIVLYLIEYNSVHFFQHSTQDDQKSLSDAQHV